ncbi:MAG TPA: cation diffusion facilitator family transporter [Anaerolineales bacterium]|jgi:cobalt-zinc-cadmium efflux system protein
MSHQHNHDHGSSSENLRAAFFLNLGFTVLELIVGLWTNSVAILSDSVHDLGDSLSLGLSWLLERRAGRGSDRRYTYGYRRYSLLGALTSTIVLLAGSLFVLAEALPRLLQPEQPNASGMALFALVGIAVNGLAVLRVGGDHSINARVIAWHLLEDVLGWVAVLIVGLVLLVWDLPVLDPVLSILITAYILFNVLRNLRRTLAVFLQAAPEELELERVEGQILDLHHVLALHHTHLWSLDGVHHVLTAHIVVDDQTSGQQIIDLKCDLRDLTADLSLEHTTFEIEFEREECGMRPGLMEMTPAPGHGDVVA